MIKVEVQVNRQIPADDERIQPLSNACKERLDLLLSSLLQACLQFFKGREPIVPVIEKPRDIAVLHFHFIATYLSTVMQVELLTQLSEIYKSRPYCDQPMVFKVEVIPVDSVS